MNQYTSRTVPDEFPVFGTALAAATVTVNSDTADRHDAYYSSVVLATNSSAAQYKKVTVEAIYNPPGTNNDYYMTSTGRVFVAKTPEVFTYDADGNMTSDGRFNYEWNAENRLVKVTTPLVGLPSNVPKVKLKMDYDQQGRRISQVRSTYDGSSWAWQETRSFIYDGWNLVGERRGTASGTTTNWYVWGLDMSGTIQGAGGVGGLLYANFNGVSHNYYAFDGNGNVSEVVGANGAVRAHYEYDPFGSSTTESGTLADENPFRFSTKYWDSDTKTLAYQLRDYNPGMGRWLSKDPIEEEGGLNIYSLAQNDFINNYDILGLRKPTDEEKAKIQEALGFLNLNIADFAIDVGNYPWYGAVLFKSLTINISGALLGYVGFGHDPVNIPFLRAAALLHEMSHQSPHNFTEEDAYKLMNCFIVNKVGAQYPVWWGKTKYKPDGWDKMEIRKCICEDPKYKNWINYVER